MSGCAHLNLRFENVTITPSTSAASFPLPPLPPFQRTRCVACGAIRLATGEWKMPDNAPPQPLQEAVIERWLARQEGMPPGDALGATIVRVLRGDLLAARRENEKLRRALIAHRADLHNGSNRPCPTCYQSAHALGIADKVPDSCASGETDRAALAATPEEKTDA